MLTGQYFGANAAPAEPVVRQSGSHSPKTIGQVGDGREEFSHETLDKL